MGAASAKANHSERRSRCWCGDSFQGEAGDANWGWASAVGDANWGWFKMVYSLSNGLITLLGSNPTNIVDEADDQQNRALQVDQNGLPTEMLSANMCECVNT